MDDAKLNRTLRRKMKQAMKRGQKKWDREIEKMQEYNPIMAPLVPHLSQVYKEKRDEAEKMLAEATPEQVKELQRDFVMNDLAEAGIKTADDLKKATET